MNAKIDKMCIAVEVDCEICFVSINADNIAMIASMIGALEPDGVLKLMKAPSDVKVCTIGEILNGD